MCNTVRLIHKEHFFDYCDVYQLRGSVRVHGGIAACVRKGLIQPQLHNPPASAVLQRLLNALLLAERDSAHLMQWHSYIDYIKIPEEFWNSVPFGRDTVWL